MKVQINDSEGVITTFTNKTWCWMQSITGCDIYYTSCLITLATVWDIFNVTCILSISVHKFINYVLWLKEGSCIGIQRANC